MALEGEHLVRYYGWYSNRSRGIRRLSGELATGPGNELDIDVTRPGARFQNRVKASWARLIRKVYEVDPLICPRCGGEMRIVAIIEQAPVIERILRHIGVWKPNPLSRGPPQPERWPKGWQIPLTYEPMPPIA